MLLLFYILCIALSYHSANIPRVTKYRGRPMVIGRQVVQPTDSPKHVPALSTRRPRGRITVETYRQDMKMPTFTNSNAWEPDDSIPEEEHEDPSPDEVVSKRKRSVSFSSDDPKTKSFRKNEIIDPFLSTPRQTSFKPEGVDLFSPLQVHQKKSSRAAKFNRENRPRFTKKETVMAYDKSNSSDIASSVSSRQSNTKRSNLKHGEDYSEYRRILKDLTEWLKNELDTLFMVYGEYGEIKEVLDILTVFEEKLCDAGKNIAHPYEGVTTPCINTPYARKLLPPEVLDIVVKRLAQHTKIRHGNTAGDVIDIWTDWLVVEEDLEMDKIQITRRQPSRKDVGIQPEENKDSDFIIPGHPRAKRHSEKIQMKRSLEKAIVSPSIVEFAELVRTAYAKKRASSQDDSKPSVYQRPSNKRLVRLNTINSWRITRLLPIVDEFNRFGLFTYVEENFKLDAAGDLKQRRLIRSIRLKLLNLRNWVYRKRLE